MIHRMTEHLGGSWSYVAAPAHPALAGVVLGYRGYRLAMGRPVQRRELPVPFGSVTVQWAGTLHLRVAARPCVSFTSLVAGMTTVPVLASHDGTLEGVEVRLHPLAAFRLFGAPVPARDHIVTLDDQLGWRRAEALVDQLGSAPDWPTRFALLDRAFVIRLAASPAGCLTVDWLWRQIQARPGRPIATWAVDIGWSQRHFQKRFRAHTGLSPKAAARVSRMHAALRAMVAGVSLDRVAAVVGYADQSHLTRDVRALTGLTPGALLSARAATSRPVDRSPGEVTSLLL